MMRPLPALVLALVAAALGAQAPAPGESASAPAISDAEIQTAIGNGKAYTLVFFKAGPATPPDDAAAIQKMQWAHLRNLFTLKAEGLATLSGPFTGPAKGDLRGLVIFNTADEAIVRARLDADPYIQSGLMTYEIQPWFGLPGDGIR
jgi:uncharacterized protein YciI